MNKDGTAHGNTKTVCSRGHDMAVTRTFAGKAKAPKCGLCRKEYMKGQKNSPSQQLKKRCNRRGISPVQFLAMVYFQGEVCAICKSSDWGDKGSCIDHNHTTGKVRGVLCWSCNIGLGKFMDNASNLRSAAAYLETR